jgi:LemA protein
MEADGILTPEQAARLRESLDWDGAGGVGNGGNAGRPGRSARGRWLVGLVAAALVIAFFLFTNGSGVDIQAPQDVAATLNDPGGIGQMNRNFSGLLAMALFLVIPAVLWVFLHNSLVTREEAVLAAWAQTESNLKRRADLIPALVDTVSRYLRHESETLTAVTGQRADTRLSDVLDELVAAQKATAELIQRDAGSIVESEAGLAALFAAQESVGQRMHSFLAVAESYPELRSSDQFLELQAQLEGTENRINVARMRFNESVASYNAAIRRLPGSLVAGVGGFKRKAYFQAGETAHDAPELAFD